MSLPATAAPADHAKALTFYLVHTPEGSVGVLDGVERDERGRASTLIVAQGWFGRRRLHVPIDQLAGVDHVCKRIVLVPGGAPIEHKGLVQRLLDVGARRPEDDRAKALTGAGWSAGRPRPVLCEITSGVHPFTAVSVAACLARGLGAPLILATTANPPPESVVASSRTPHEGDECAEVAAYTVDALLSQVAAGTQVIRSLPPAARPLGQLASEANACFLVVTARAAGDTPHDDALHDAPCPVVVVPAADRAGGGGAGDLGGAARPARLVA